MTQIILLGVQDQICAYILLLFYDFIENVVIKTEHLYKVRVVKFQLL